MESIKLQIKIKQNKNICIDTDMKIFYNDAIYNLIQHAQQIFQLKITLLEGDQGHCHILII